MPNCVICRKTQEKLNAGNYCRDCFVKQKNGANLTVNGRLDQLEKSLSAATNKINDLLGEMGHYRNKIYYLEKNLCILNQYSRRENIEIIGKYRYNQ